MAMDVVKPDRKSERTREIALQKIGSAISVIALTLALAGCFECRPGDVRGTNHTPVCGGTK